MVEFSLYFLLSLKEHFSFLFSIARLFSAIIGSNDITICCSFKCRLLFQFWKKLTSFHNCTSLSSAMKGQSFFLPSTNYSCSFPFHFLAVTSVLYCRLLPQSLPQRSCSICLECHDQIYLCLPNFLHQDSTDLLLHILAMETQLPVICKGSRTSRETKWLLIDQMECRVFRKLVALGRSSRLK